MADTPARKPKNITFLKIYASGKYYVTGIRKYTDEHPIYLLAAGLAFNALLCIVPVVLFLFYGLGIWLEKRSILDVIDGQLHTFIPQDNYRATIINVLRDQIFLIIRNGRVAGLIGLLGSLWTGSTLFASARTALNRVYGFRPERFFFLYKLRDIGMVLVLGILVIAAMCITPFAHVATYYGSSFFSSETNRWLGSAIPFVFSVLFSLVLFFLLYRSLAHHKVETRSAFAGAVTATVLWECAKVVFTFYLMRFTMLGVLYGTYTFLVVAALWIYYSAAVFIIGGVVTRLYWEREEAKASSV
ncbi:MAG TPA: YihY/virulence factor BrkB family protein [Candidatus Kapabacteria bacterium]|nr:YihY/virulence factor BrkB family protein [Candidatus Kapabacteria bacterium]